LYDQGLGYTELAKKIITKKVKNPVGLVDGHRSLVAKAKRFTSRGRSKWPISGPDVT